MTIELDPDSDGAIDIILGGTGAKTAADARANLGLGTSAEIMAIVNSVPVAGHFTTLECDSLAIDAADGSRALVIGNNTTYAPSIPEDEHSFFFAASVPYMAIAGTEHQIQKALRETQHYSSSGNISVDLITGGLITNYGATGDVTRTLPPGMATVGSQVTVRVLAAQNFIINPPDTMQIIEETDAVGDAISCATVGSEITLVTVSATQILPIGTIGPWADVN